MTCAQRINARGLLCPLPVIKLQEFARNTDRIVEVTMTATDPGVLQDVPSWCRVNGHKHISSQASNHEYQVTVRIVPHALRRQSASDTAPEA